MEKDIKIKLTIGQLAKEAGVNIQTIRYYEKRKLLKPSGRNNSGYRFYRESDLKKIKFIKQAQNLGFLLEEISELLELRANTPNQCKIAAKYAEIKLQEVRGKIKLLKSIEKQLKSIKLDCESNKNTSNCPMIEQIEGIE
jgi:Hg(II)-responsive transcriptional regulator